MKIEKTQIDESKKNPTNIITVDFGKNENEVIESLPEDDSEYEYVPFNEVLDGSLGKIRKFFVNNIVIVMCVLILVIGFLAQLISQYASTILVAVAFTILAVLAVVALYFSWNEKKAADERYLRAKETLAPVNKKIHNVIDDDDE